MLEPARGEELGAPRLRTDREGPDFRRRRFAGGRKSRRSDYAEGPALDRGCIRRNRFGRARARSDRIRKSARKPVRRGPGGSEEGRLGDRQHYRRARADRRRRVPEGPDRNPAQQRLEIAPPAKGTRNGWRFVQLKKFNSLS